MKNEIELKEAFSSYVSILNKIDERRKLWNDGVKQIILNTLNSIVDKHKHTWHVQDLNRAENYQTVNISCDNMPSGIIETQYDKTHKPSGFKAYAKYGGYLAYGQSFNGKIHVFIGFPYIEDFVSQKPSEMITTLEPEQITEDLVISHVIKFMKTMQEWEDSYGDRDPVGYKI